MAEPITGASFGFNQGASFVSSAPTDHRGQRDSRFMQANDKSGGKGMWNEGENTFAVLPPFSNYIDRYIAIRDKAQQDGVTPVYPMGHIYYRLNPKVGSSSNRGYRVPLDNPFNQAMSTLYYAMVGEGKFTEELKAIANHLVGGPKYGFRPDSRFLINVGLSEDFTRVRWFDTPFNDESDDGDPNREDRIGTKIVNVFSEYSCKTPRSLPLFDLDENVPLVMDVSIKYMPKGNKLQAMPSWIRVNPKTDASGNLNVVNIRRLLEKSVPDWCEEMLDDLGKWASEYDDLPDFGDIPNLAANGRACEILGISTKNAQAPGRVHAQGNPTPVQQMDFGAVTPSQQQPQQQAVDPGGFGGPPVQQSMGSSVGDAFSTFDQAGANAAQQFKAEIEGASGGTTGMTTPAADVASEVDDEPPF